MPKSEIRNGRKYLLFDDPQVQAFYDALFRLGEQDCKTPFDVNSAADLAKIGIIDPADAGEETAVFPMRFDMEKIDREQKLETTFSGIALGEGKKEETTVLGWYTPEEKEAHDRLAETDPALWRAERKEKEDSVCEGYLRRNIRRMMEGHVVLMDEKKQDYPRSLRVKDDSATIADVAAAAPAEMPEEPEKPTFYGLISFFYNIFGWGKDVVEPYRQSMAQYHEQVANLREQDTERRVSEKLWPEYATEGKKVPRQEPDKVKKALDRITVVSDAMIVSQRNLKAVFGPKPAMQSGMISGYEPVIDSIDPNAVAEPVNGISDDQSAAFTHVSMMTTEISENFLQGSTLFKKHPDHPMVKNRDMQMFSANAHMVDLQMGRSGKEGMNLFAKEYSKGSVVAQSHKVAKEAYEMWAGEKKDPSLIGKVLAEGLPVLTQSLCRNELGITTSYVATMQECEHIYTMMQEHPELRDAAIEKGLSQDTLQCMEANHQMYQLLHRGAEAQKELLSGRNMSNEEARELLTDALLMEYAGNILIEDYKKVEKEVMSNISSLQDSVEESTVRAKLESEKWERLIEKAATPEEKADLEQKHMAAREKNNDMISLEGGMISDRLGAQILVKSASEKYRTLSKSEKLEQIRNTVKNSRVVTRFVNMPQVFRASEFARIVGKDTSPEYKRLHVELSAAIDNKIMDVPDNAPKLNRTSVVSGPAKTETKQVEPMVPGARK